MDNNSILIVDDNALNLKLAKVILVGGGYEVHTAGDAEEALSVLQSFHPKLILMDIQLPGLDGLELTRLLKKDPLRKQIKIVALTAYAMKGDDQKAFAAGCEGYIIKPINPETFLQEIAAYL